MDYSQLVHAAKRLSAEKCPTQIRLALLADSSTQHLVPLLRTLFYERNIGCAIYEAPFDAIDLEVHDTSSGLYMSAPDVIAILNALQALRAQFAKRRGSASQFVDETVEHVVRPWETIRSHTNATILQTTFVLPYERFFGNFDNKVSDSFYRVVTDINAQIVRHAQAFSAVLINDVEYIAAFHGKKDWFDDRFWDIAKAFASIDKLPYVAKNIVQIVAAQRGQVVKCVILDLDNTLWGGIIGDDGLDGIKLNAHGEGECFYRLQIFLKELTKRGILLAVCSKNQLENALLPFEKHPEMILKRADIACFVANWQDKAENIRAIRDTLTIGFDSMVFLDDNPFERNVVRELVPGILVPELPEDPGDYVQAIAELNLFETTSFSDEDLHRTELYRQESVRRETQASFASFEDFLQSLDMEMTLAIFDSYHLPRIAQLLQRSNQFNLTTRRLSEAECGALAEDERYLPLYVKLKDRLGDHGLISVVVLEILPGQIAIRDWLMSCRVLKRGVEQAVMNFVFESAARCGATKVTGEYMPTAKNNMVKDFFAQFGFERTSDTAGHTTWAHAVSAYSPGKVYIDSNMDGVKHPSVSLVS